MGRIKRGYVREVLKKRDYHLFAIACEGSVRERDYFECFEKLSSRITVDLLYDVDDNGELVLTTNSSPEYVIARAEQYCKEASLIDEDDVWLIIDVDRWGDQQLSELCQIAVSKGWNVAISNPCFEVWLCYHLVPIINDEGKCLSSAEMKQLLGVISLPEGYNCLRFAPKAFIAAENARKVDNHPEFRIPEYKETQVYKLIDSMRAYSSEEEIAKFEKFERLSISQT